MEYSIYFVVAFIILVFRLDNIAAAWQNGKANVEAQKTMGELAKERQEVQRTRQEELKLERAKLENRVSLS